jgi:hypothetical protein
MKFDESNGSQWEQVSENHANDKKTPKCMNL